MVEVESQNMVGKRSRFRVPCNIDRAPVTKPEASDLPAKIGRYDIRAKLADGGMATVYVGRLSGPAGFERVVAIKVIKPEYSQDKSFVNMFLDEARIAARLSHPSIVQVHELGEDEGAGTKRLFIVMVLLFGESLWDVWYTAQKRGKPLPLDMAAWIGARVAEGLDHAHELHDAAGVKQNVIHRDINPSNLFITYDGQVKIIDFGLAKAKNRVTETGLGVLKGKVAYMAPEQTRAAKDLDHRADIFALGTTLYELTTNRRLFKRGDNVSTLAAVAEAKVPDPSTMVPDYSPELWSVLKKALAKSRDDRYDSAKEMVAALDAVSRSQGRVVTAATVAAFMEDLFGAERQRYSTFLEEVRSERPVPQEVFRPKSEIIDDNAEIVGVDVPVSNKAGSESVPMPLTKRADPYAPPPPPDEAPAEELKENRQAWIWAVVFLIAAIATVWFAMSRM